MRSPYILVEDPGLAETGPATLGGSGAEGIESRKSGLYQRPADGGRWVCSYRKSESAAGNAGNILTAHGCRQYFLTIADGRRYN